MEQNRRIIGIDPGNENSGVAIIENHKILHCENVQNENLWSLVSCFAVCPALTIAIEAIKPYSQELSPQVIDTAYFIGEARFRLRMAFGDVVRLIPRAEVRRWVFNRFPATVLPLISVKMGKKEPVYQACRMTDHSDISVYSNGRGPSFVWVDDAMVAKAMKVLYNIDRFKGITSHAVQALAVANYVRLNC